MQAARLHEYGKPLVIDDVPRPTPGAGRSSSGLKAPASVTATSISSLATFRCFRGCLSPSATRTPVPVSAIGAGVHAVKEGDRVAVYGGWGDGFCDYCVAGEENLCPTMQWVGLSQHERSICSCRTSGIWSR